MSEITPEESTNQTETPYFKAPENHAHFALVIDGKLSWLHSVDHALSGAVQVFQASPKIIEITSDQFESFLNGGIPPYGNYRLDGENWVLEQE